MIVLECSKDCVENWLKEKTNKNYRVIMKKKAILFIGLMFLVLVLMLLMVRNMIFR
jgi:hypothetical protein